MNIAKYCHDKKMSKEEYNNFKENIKTLALAIKTPLQYRNGIYYSTGELFTYNTNEDIKHFLIQELKL
ncbi:hypothetical protein [Clostridium tagluense]|uniref:Uncharacterized protein n=1 Tax=Clostridium tagluense TaxID=360422 RepID=A0A401USW2_9CLOT|nr:hypothetical protein [Clostridium tagluense]GCD12596.1 hypothetical protein Ctaglu_42190 [Clostridium tagluense]